MDNVGGGLGFKATLDIEDFNISADAMDRRIRDISSGTLKDTESMDQAFMNFAHNAARYITTTLVGGGMMGLVNSIIQTRGQFQQLSIAFDTMLGSQSKSKALMDQIVNTAARTPFDLMGVASGAKQLLAYGESADKVNETLVRLGNIASGLSIPLNDIVYLYGTTMVQGRLYAQDVRQFTGRGIPLVRELANEYGKTAEEINAMVSEGKIGFPQVEKVINKMTDSGGQFYNLMEKQSKSLSGMVSNLSDAWDTALNKIGEDNQGVLSAGISSASYLVQHMQTILDVIKAIAISYGSYKAAVALSTLAVKGHTGIALIDNTVSQAKIALMRIDASLTGQVAAQTKVMTEAQAAHVASLQSQLTANEQLNLSQQLRAATIEQLLTAQQQQYISNLGLTTSSVGYEAAAMQVLTVDQKAALEKTDLSAKSVIYQAALEKEVASKKSSSLASIEAMRADVKAASAKLESAKMSAIAAQSAVDMANYQVYIAKQQGNATAIATAEKKLEGAVENESIARKTALAASSDFYTKKKILETAATESSTASSIVDTSAKATQATATSVLTAITTRCTIALKALWASMLTNPVGWLVGIIGIAVTALTLFHSKSKETKTAMGDFQDSVDKATSDLRINMAVLQNAANGTETHKKALDRINSLCKEYNKTLLDENATLEQQKKKYKELSDAIQATTAEKIKAKYTEQAAQEYTDKQTEALDKLKKSASQASYNSNVTNQGSAGAQSFQVAAYNIRKASQALWDEVNSESVDAAEKLKNLSGKAYQQAFDESVNRIMAGIKQATGASDNEINGFRAVIVKNLTDITGSAKQTDQEIGNVTNELYRFNSVQPNGKVKQAVDYASMSFEQLNGIIKSTQSQIDSINKKEVWVKADYTQVKELKGILDQINLAISNKNATTNTENGINARIQQLKDERADVDINSSKYKELSTQIKEWENKLPKTASKEADSAQQLLDKKKEFQEKETQLALKAEQSRIDIMDDGYAKRKAQLDLQHKQTIADINKQMNDLEKDRKSSKSGLSTDDKSYYNELLENENKSYEKQQQKLFDGELEYQKGQYETYFKWVETMGVDAANKQFSNLIAGGASYKDYLENEIKKYTEGNQTNLLLRQGRSDLSEGEANHLINLKIQYQEVTGAKTAMDTFKDSLERAIDKAQTLSEKLKALSDAKESILNGSSGLVGADQKAQGGIFINEKQTSLEKELAALVDQYKDYAQKKKDIESKYDDDILLLNEQRNKAIKENDQESIDKYSAAIELASRERSESISKVTLEGIQSSMNWEKVFGDLSTLSQTSLSLLEKQLSAIINTNKDLKPEQVKILNEKLRETRQIINTFKPLDNIFGDYKKAADAKKQLNELDNSIQQFMNNTTDSGKTVGEVYSSAVANMDNETKAAIENMDVTVRVKDATGQWVEQTMKLCEALDLLKNKEGESTQATNTFKDKFNGIMSSIGGNSNSGIWSIIGGKFGGTSGGSGGSGGAAGVLMMVDSIIQAVHSNIDGLEETMKEWNAEDSEFGKFVGKLGKLDEYAYGGWQKLKQGNVIGAVSDTIHSWGALVDLFGEDTKKEYEDAKEEYTKLIDVWNELIDKKKEYLSQSWGQEAQNAYDESLNIIKKEEEAARSLGKEYLNAGAGTFSHSNGINMRNEMTDEGWNQVKQWASNNGINGTALSSITGGRMTGLFDLTAEQLEKLKSDAPVFWAKLDGDVQTYLNSIIESNDKLDDMKNTLNENLTGVDFDTFSDSILSDLEDVDVKAEDVFSNVSEYMRKALIQNMYKSQFKDSIEKWYQMWSDAMSEKSEGGSEITADEQAALDTLKTSIVNGATSAAKKINEQFSSGTAESEDALTGAVKSMSEETGSVIAGRLNAIVINQSANGNTLREILIATTRTADNTGYTVEELKKVNTKLDSLSNNSLLTQGIS